jgi:signal peptidase I
VGPSRDPSGRGGRCIPLVGPSPAAPAVGTPRIQQLHRPIGMVSKRRRKESIQEERTDRPGQGREGGASPKGEEMGKGSGENVLLEWVKSLAVALVLFFIIRSFLLHTFVIISGSMEDTLLVGDLLLVNRAAVGSPVPGTSWRIPGYSTVKRGDVLVFDPPHEQDLKLVKRLVGLPGDTMEMRQKILYVNGRPLDEPYVQHQDPHRDDVSPWMSWQRGFLLGEEGDGEYRPTRDNWGPLLIPPDHYFMLGDNRDTSLDSRYWGLLEGWRLEGRAVLIYFSYNKGSLRPFPALREIRWGRVGSRVR